MFIGKMVNMYDTGGCGCVQKMPVLILDVPGGAGGCVITRCVFLGAPGGERALMLRRCGGSLCVFSGQLQWVGRHGYIALGVDMHEVQGVFILAYCVY